MENSDEHSICEMLPPMRSVKSNEQNKDVTIANSTADTDIFKKNPNTMSDDDDKCVNNQDICYNKKNVKTINKNDCNVVIDDETQSKQQQQQPQLKKQQQQQSPPQTYGCVHYKRKAKFVVSPNENNRFK